MKTGNDWNQASEILSDWLEYTEIGVRQLARLADVPPSVISKFKNSQTTLNIDTAYKIYKVISRNLDARTRRNFADNTGVSELLYLAAKPTFTSDTSNYVPVNSKEIAIELHALATRMKHKDWSKSLLLLIQAEQLFGKLDARSGTIGIEVAQMYINLGDYRQALETLQRVESRYTSILDPYATFELSNRYGWLHFYSNSLIEAQRYFQKCLKIADFYEQELWKMTSYHFLARIEGEFAAKTNGDKQKYHAHRASDYFDKYDHITKVYDPYNENPFNVFRRSQALMGAGFSQDAKELRSVAKDMFLIQSNGQAPYVDVEESKIDLVNGESLRKIQKRLSPVIESWSSIQYARGVAGALKILAEGYYVDGNSIRACEVICVALCIHPLESRYTKEKMIPLAKQIVESVIFESSHRKHKKFIRDLYEQALQRTGAFSHLNTVTISDMNENVEAAFTLLGLSKVED